MAWSTDHTPRPHLWSIKESRCVTAPSNQRAQWMRDPRPHLTWDWLGWGRTLEMFGPPSRLVELDAAAGAYPALAGYFKGEIVTAWRPEPLASMSRGGSLADRTCAVTRLVWQQGTTCLVRLGTTTILMCIPSYMGSTRVERSNLRVRLYRAFRSKLLTNKNMPPIYNWVRSGVRFR